MGSTHHPMNTQHVLFPRSWFWRSSWQLLGQGALWRKKGKKLIALEKLGFALLCVLPMCTKLIKNPNVHCSQIYFCYSKGWNPTWIFVAMWMRLKECNLASCHVLGYDKLMLTSAEHNNMSELVTKINHEPWGFGWKHKQSSWIMMGPWLIKTTALCNQRYCRNAYKMYGGIEWGACITNRCSNSFLAVGRSSGFLIKHWRMKSCASLLKCSGIGGSSPFKTLKKNANCARKQNNK